MEKPISLAVLISGTGSTLKNLWISRQRIPAEILLVINSKAGSLGAEWARNQNIPVKEIIRKEYSHFEAFSHAITHELDRVKPELIILAGFIHHYQIPPHYKNQVMNIHPSLIPAFCGKGFYGEKVHQAVLDRGVQYSGCTVHFADNDYDQGPIILQRVVEVTPEDTIQTLSTRVFLAECEAYPQAIQWFQQKKLKIQGNRVLKNL
ncbi:MAG: phosphoribosylglycinamide formyltransferase [Planctomycetota bacterium]